MGSFNSNALHEDVGQSGGFTQADFEDLCEGIKTPMNSPATTKSPHAIRKEREHAERARQTQMVVEAAINATKMTITEASASHGKHSREEELEESEMSLNIAITQKKKAKVELIKVRQKRD